MADPQVPPPPPGYSMSGGVPPPPSGYTVAPAAATSGNPAPVPGDPHIPISGVPNGPRFGMNDDQVLKASGYTDAQISKIKSSSSYKPGTFSSLMNDPNSLSVEIRRDPAVAPSMVALNAIGTLPSGAMEGANHLLGLMGLRNDSDVMLSDAQRRVREMDFRQNVLPDAYYNSQGQTPLATKAVDMAGQAVPFMLGGAEAKGAEGAVGLGTKVLRGIGTGAKVGAISGALQPVNDPNADYYSTKGKDIFLGGTGGAIFGGVTAPAAPLVGKLLNYKGTAATPLEAAQNVAAKFRTDMENAGFSSIDDVRAAAAKGNPKAKSALLTMEAISPNPDAVLQADALGTFFGKKAASDKMYVDVSKAMGNDPFPATNTQQALSNAADSLSADLSPNPALQSHIKGMQARLGDGNATYPQLQKLRSDMGNLVKSRYTAGNSLISSDDDVALLQQIKNASAADMRQGALASGKPQVNDLQNAADSNYQQNVAPYKGIFAKSLDPGQTTSDTMFGKLFGPRVSPQQAQNNYNLLDPKGQGAVRSLIVDRAIQNASGKTATGELTSEFDPGKFAQSLKSMSNTSGIAFKGADKWQLDGLGNVMEHLATVNKRTAFLGSPRMMMFSGAGAAYGAAKGQGMESLAAFTPELARAAIMSPAGQRFLISASDLKPGSPAMTALIQNFMGKLPQAGGALAGQTGPNLQNSQQPKQVQP